MKRSGVVAILLAWIMLLMMLNVSSAIVESSTVDVKARGNTKYKDAGFSSITISGSVGWPK